jgi:ribosome biogenesis GTPase A
MNEVIGRLAELAQCVGDETSIVLTRDLAEQLSRGELNLLVVGQFKRGKSTLINALLHDDVLPTGVLPITSIATGIRYGPVPSVEVQLARDRTPLKIGADDLALYVSEQYNPTNALGVVSVTVSWPSELIRGLALFDTPGVGSTFEHNTLTARATLSRADAAVLVVGPEPPIGAEELQYAREVRGSSEHLFIVLNKSDLAGDGLQEVIDFTRSAIKDVFGDSNKVDVFPLSATRARTAQREGHDDPAFTSFVQALHRFLKDRGDETREASPRRRAAAIITRLDTLVAMRCEAFNLPRTERQRRKALVEHVLQALDDRVRTLELTVDDDVKQLTTALRAELDALYESDTPLACAESASLSKERSSRRRSERLGALMEERAAAWRASIIEHAYRQLSASTARYVRLLGELETAALEAGCDALHVDTRSVNPDYIEFTPTELELIASFEPTTGLELIIPFVVDILPGPLREPLLKRRYERILERELDALRGKLRYSASRELEPWRRSARATISDFFQSTKRSVLGAFSELSSSADGTEQAELSRLNNLRHGLDALRQQLISQKLAS